MENLRVRTLVLMACVFAVGAAADAQPKRGDRIKVSVTAYCIEGETKSGVQTRRGIVAADPSVLPIGTIVRVDGLKSHNGRYIVQDTGRAIKGRELDIFMPDCGVAKRFGRQEARARIIRVGKGES